MIKPNLTTMNQLVSGHTLSQVEVWGVGAEITQSATSVIV
jgi:hypothetical protein